MRIVYLGTPKFSAKALDYLINNDVNIVAVVTRIDKPKGRSGTPTPPPVKELLQEKHPSIPILQPKKASSPEFIEELASYNPDIIVCAAYGAIIKEAILDMPEFGCLNLHTSLLPKYRGAAPIQRCVINGEKRTGVTIMQMAKGLDTGDIIKTIETPIDENTTAGELEDILCSLGKVLMLDVIKDIEHNKIVKKTVQDHSKATYAQKIKTEDCEIIWTQQAEKLHNIVRGTTPYPGAWCNIIVRGKPKRMKIKKTVIEEITGSQPGEIISYDSNGLLVACESNALKIMEVQLEGKKPMTIEEFSRGFSKEVITFI